MNQLQVKASRLPLVMVIVLGLFFVPMALALLDGFRFAQSAIGLTCLVLYGIVVWLVRRGHKKSVRRFTEEGLVRNDGRSYDWADLSNVVEKVRVRHGRKYVWRTEIHFTNGESAWLIPSKVNNYAEAAALVGSLRCAHTEVAA